MPKNIVFIKIKDIIYVYNINAIYLCVATMGDQICHHFI